MPRDPEAIFAAQKKTRIPFDFVLEELADLDPLDPPDSLMGRAR
jgi:hypothetical protein